MPTQQRETPNFRECKTCDDLLRKLAEATGNHSVVVGRLVDSTAEHYSRLHDEAGEAGEIAAAAETVYKTHREEHNSPLPP